MKKNRKKLLALMLAGVMLTACGNKAEVAETKDTTAASGEESQAASDAAEQETAADTQQTDLEGAEVTFWYMPVYEGFDEKMSRDLAQEVKDKYGIILNTEVLTWDAGPE